MKNNSQKEKEIIEEEFIKRAAQLKIFDNVDQVKAMLNYFPKLVKAGFSLREKKATSGLTEEEEMFMGVVLGNLPNYIAFVIASRIEGAEHTLQQCLDYYAEMKLKAQQGDPKAKEEYEHMRPSFEEVLKSMNDK